MPQQYVNTSKLFSFLKEHLYSIIPFSRYPPRNSVEKHARIKNTKII
jgi:hypothetical protein